MTTHVDKEKGLSKRMEYDSNNRIVKVINGINNQNLGEYSYDDQGFRVKKVTYEGGTVKEVIHPSMYYGFDRQQVDTETGKKQYQNYHEANNLYINGVRLAVVDQEGRVQYYHTDQVDSVKVVTNQYGMPVTNTEFLPYGETWFQTGDKVNGPKYNSQELDKESGFYYYNARHYDAEIGRFVTADSVVDGEYSVSGWNRYMYCGGNPVGYRDPTGHNKLSEENKETATFSQMGAMGYVIYSGFNDDGKNSGIPVKEASRGVASAFKGAAIGAVTMLRLLNPNGAMDIEFKTQVGDAIANEAKDFAKSPKKYVSKKVDQVVKKAKENPYRFGGEVYGGVAITAMTGGASKFSPKNIFSKIKNASTSFKQFFKSLKSIKKTVNEFIVGPDGIAVHKSQKQMVDSIVNVGAKKIKNTSATSELGVIYELKTSKGVMEIRVMKGKNSAGNLKGPRTVITRPGTLEYINKDGSRIKGAVSKSQRKAIGHIHGQVE